MREHISRRRTFISYSVQGAIMVDQRESSRTYPNKECDRNSGPTLDECYIQYHRMKRGEKRNSLYPGPTFRARAIFLAPLSSFRFPFHSTVLGLHEISRFLYCLVSKFEIFN